MAFAVRKWAGGNAGPLVAGIAMVLAAALLQLLEPSALQRVGLAVFDSYQRAQPRDHEDARVRAVVIDEESLRRHGQWPWPRTEIARLTDRLAAAGARAIAFDIVFSEPDRTSPAHLAAQLRQSGASAQALAALSGLPDNDARLAASFARAPTVTGYFLINERNGGTAEPKAGMAVAGSAPDRSVPRFAGAVMPLSPIQAAARGSGFVSLAAGSDGMVREVPLLAWQNGQLLPSLSLEAVRVAQQAGAVMVRTSDASGESGSAPGKVVAIKTGEVEVPTTAAGGLWMYYTAPRVERAVPAWRVLDGTLDQQAMARAFAGRIVFVGASAIGLRDLVATPLGDHVPGVLVHAEAAEQMILGRFLVRPDWAPGVERALLLGLGLILALALPRLGAARGAALGLLLVAAAMWGSWFAFSRHRFLLDPTYPVLALLLTYLVQTALVYLREERRRAFIHNAFDRYLSPELVRRIAAQPGLPELGGEERDMTVLSCDIRGFSGLAEHMGPQATIRFLIGFLTPMCDVLLARKATLDKFVGDAILAFWNAPLDDPDQYENAALAAMAMVAELDRLNRERPDCEGEPWPGQVRMGIGINAGRCCVGNMGSAQRLSYSLIGDTVNLVSRIEGLTRIYPVPIIIGDELRKRLTGYAMLELDRVQVLGRETPETVHSLLGDGAMAASAEFKALAECHREMLESYRSQAWEEAGAQLDRLVEMAPDFGLEELYPLYRLRIAELSQQAPGASWDGVYRATKK